MAATAISHLIEKKPIIDEYISAWLPAKIPFVRAGIAVANPTFESTFDVRGGQTFTVPHYPEFTTAAQVPAAATDLDVYNLTSGSEVGVVIARAQAVGVEDLAAVIGATDPAAEWARQQANYWAKVFNTSLQNVLTGAFGDALAATHVVDKSAFDFEYGFIIEAADVLGDESDSLGALLVHSKVYHKMRALNLVTYNNIQGPAMGEILTQRSIGNRQLFVSDLLPKSGTGDDTTYSSYLMAPGCMSLSYSESLRMELERQPLKGAGTDVFVTRAVYNPHLYGVSWKGTTTWGTFNSEANLSTSGNWEKKYTENKLIRAVELKSKAVL
jgi:hypothetical protein